MKRFAMAALALLLAFLALAGCRGGNPAKPVTITMWHYYIGEQKKALDDMVSLYNAQEGYREGVVVEAVSKASIADLNTEIGNAIQKKPGAGDTPDIFLAYADGAYDLAEQELLVDYTQYLDAGELEAYVPAFLEEGKIRGDDRVYILPVAKATEVLIINKTDFEAFCEEANAVRRSDPISMDSFDTWEGILEAAEAYYDWTAQQETSGVGKALFGIDSVANFLFTTHRQMGADLMAVRDGQGVVDLSSGVLERVWQYYAMPMIRGQYARYGRFRSDDLKTGDILAYLGASSSGAYLPDQVVKEDGASYPVELEVRPMPPYKEGSPCAVQQGAGMAIFASEPEREAAAARFAAWCTEPERNTDFAAKSSYLPVTTRAVEALEARYAGGVEGDGVAQVLSAAIWQIESGYEMFIPPVFAGSYQVRSILESALTAHVMELRDGYLSDLSAGVDADYLDRKYGDEAHYRAYVDECARLIEEEGIPVLR